MVNFYLMCNVKEVYYVINIFLQCFYLYDSTGEIKMLAGNVYLSKKVKIISKHEETWGVLYFLSLTKVSSFKLKLCIGLQHTIYSVPLSPFI